MHTHIHTLVVFEKPNRSSFTFSFTFTLCHTHTRLLMPTYARCTPATRTHQVQGDQQLKHGASTLECLAAAGGELKSGDQSAQIGVHRAGKLAARVK